MFSIVIASPFLAMSEAIKQVTNQLVDLNSRLVTINEQIGRLESNMSNLGGFIGTQIEGYIGVDKKEDISAKGEQDRTAKNIITVTKGLAGMASSGVKVYEAFEKLSPAMENVKKGVGVVKGIVELAGGIEAMASAAGFVEGVTALTSIVGGSGEILAILAGLGGVGLAIGAGILLAGGIATFAAVDRQAKKEEAPTFADVAAQNGNPYLLQRLKAQQLADLYSANFQSPNAQSDIEVQKAANRLRDTLLKKGGVIQFDWRRGESRDPVYLRGLANAMIESFTMSSHPIKQLLFDDENDMKAFRTEFDPLFRFPLAARPNIVETQRFFTPKRADGPSQTVTIDVPISQKEYDKKHTPASRPKTAIDYLNDGLLTVGIESYLKNGEKYVEQSYKSWLQEHSAIRGFEQYAKTFYNRYQKARKPVDEDKALSRIPLTIDQRKNNSPEGSAGKVIHVNINRSLIGNFTIQTSEAKGGITRLKQEVEQALLEVLNAANSIN